MKTLVVYDSFFGNTKIIAEILGQELKAKVKSISEYQIGDLDGLDLLIVGSPIRGWMPSENTQKFLADLNQLNGLRAAAFDTRVKLFIHGDAASKISHSLELLGAKIISPPHFFYVSGSEGPLLSGESEKALLWAREIVSLVNLHSK